MKTLDRRQWLRSAGLSSGFLFLGGLETMALDFPARAIRADRMIELNANENPYGPSKKVREAITNSFGEACRYPFKIISSLEEMIAEKEGVPKACVVVTGGSTEGLRAAGLVYGLGGGEIIAADPTFQSLLTYAENFGAYVHRVPLNDQLGHDLNAMNHRITSKTSLIFICNPNNPTGTLLDRDQLKDFCTSVDHQAVIFSDEAYYDFITEPDYPSMVELVKEGRNVIVSKTFSKVYGLAGLRVGYLITRPDIAERLNSAVMAGTNIPAIAAARTAIKDEEFYKFSIAKNEEAKEYIYQTLESLKLAYQRSHTNFVFFQSGRPIDELMQAMKNENILIGRPFPPMYDWARISTGTMPEMKLFGAALKKVMA
ncbi:MAG: histidinol-phosphate transaminase [Lutimonas sp.]